MFFLQTCWADSPKTDDDFSILFAYVNDNYSATWINGYTENYIGADDFITASFLLRVFYNEWRIGLTYNVVTSRLFNFRYDMLALSTGREQSIKNFKLNTQIGVLIKGDLGGKTLQNGWHRFTGLSKVDIPYSRSRGIAALVEVIPSWSHKNLLLSGDLFSTCFELKLVSKYAPWRFSPAVSYRMELIENYLQLEILAGWRFYLNEVAEYSELVRPGLLTAVNLKWKAYKQVYLDFGISWQPTRNLMEDFRYGHGKFKYLPQIWLGFSWNSAQRSLTDYIDY